MQARIGKCDTSHGGSLFSNFSNFSYTSKYKNDAAALLMKLSQVRERCRVRAVTREMLIAKDIPWRADINRTVQLIKFQDLYDVIEESTTPNQPPVSAIIEWLVRELAQVVDINQEAVATNESFSHFGLDSAKAARFTEPVGGISGSRNPSHTRVEIPND